MSKSCTFDNNYNGREDSSEVLLLSFGHSLSYGHVEYGGRVVVQRLVFWEVEGTTQRSHATVLGNSVLPSIVSLLDGGGRFSLVQLEILKLGMFSKILSTW